MMKIAYVVETFPNLTETFIQNEVESLSDAGITIVVLALKRSGGSSKLPPVKIYYRPNPLVLFYHLLRCPNVWIGFRGLFRFRFMSRFRNFLIANYFSGISEVYNVHHIHAHFAFVSTDIALILSEIIKKPFSFTAHAKDIYTNNHRLLAKKIFKSRFVVTCSEFNRKFLIGLSGETSKIHAIYHGIELKRWLQKYKGRTDDKVRLITVCRLVEKKGTEYLLKAVKICCENGIDVECTVIGDGPLKSKLVGLTKSLGIQKRVRFLGSVPSYDIHSYLGQSDIFILPSVLTSNGDRDIIPNVFLEAMAVGVPVISSRTAAIQELIEHGYNGVLVPERNAERLFAAIQFLITNPSGSMRIAVSARSKLKEKFDLQTSTHKLIELFETYAAN